MRKILLIIGVCYSLHVTAFPCFLTIVKDNCWTNYNVTATITNAKTGKAITSVIVPQGQSWTREPFTCQPADTFSLSAIFTPVFWQNDEGKVYLAQHNWNLPETVAPGDTAWNITVCYPQEFSEVPLPPSAGGNCVCDTTKIPPVKPQ